MNYLSYFKLHLLLILIITITYLAYAEFKYFWVLLPISLLIPTVITHKYWSNNIINFSLGKSLVSGILSGFILYLFFRFSYGIGDKLNIALLSQIQDLYKLLTPKNVYQWAVIFILLIPLEEIFWRGVVFNKLKEQYCILLSLFISIILYAIIQMFSGTYILPIAAFTGGLFWTILYIRTQSLVTVIISHLVFDLLLLVIFPIGI